MSQECVDMCGDMHLVDLGGTEQTPIGYLAHMH